MGRRSEKAVAERMLYRYTWAYAVGSTKNAY